MSSLTILQSFHKKTCEHTDFLGTQAATCLCKSPFHCRTAGLSKSEQRTVKFVKDLHSHKPRLSSHISSFLIQKFLQEKNIWIHMLSRSSPCPNQAPSNSSKGTKTIRLELKLSFRHYLHHFWKLDFSALMNFLCEGFWHFQLHFNLFL